MLIIEKQKNFRVRYIVICYSNARRRIRDYEVFHTCLQNIKEAPVRAR